ncbi:MAG: MFS transporter [Paracoccaceae bacterium]
MQRERWAVAAMFMANGLIIGAWAPQIPLLLPRHGIDKAQLGLLILLLGLGAVGAMLLSGQLIARHGSRLVLAVLSVAVMVALPLVVFAPDLWLLAPAMVVFGALVGMMDVAMNANAVLVERRLGRAIMSSSHGFWSLGGFAGGALGGLFLDRFGAGAQALAVAAAVLAMALTAIPFLAPDPPAAPVATGHNGGRRRLLPRDPGLWLIGGLALAAMVPEGAILDWAALYLRQELGTDVARSGLAFALFSGAMAAMRFAGDGIRNRFGAVAVARISGLIGAAGLLIAAAAPVDGLAIAGFALAGLGIANMVPIMFSAAGNHPGLPAGVGISTVTMLGYCGILVAPSTIGFVAEHIGFRITYAVLAGLLVLVAALAGRVAAADGARAACPA